MFLHRLHHHRRRRRTGTRIWTIAPGWCARRRTVLKEMGLDLARRTEIRVWDTSADTRYMVLPLQPARTQGWDAEALAGIVTQDAMIGVAELK